MKIKLTRPDGTVIEAEGTVEECQTFALALSPSPTVAPQPLTISPRPIQQQFPWEPWQVVPWVPTNPQDCPWVNPTTPQTWPGTHPWDLTPHVWWGSPLGVNAPTVTTDRIYMTGPLVTSGFTGYAGVPGASTSFTMC